MKCISPSNVFFTIVLSMCWWQSRAAVSFTIYCVHQSKGLSSETVNLNSSALQRGFFWSCPWLLCQFFNWSPLNMFLFGFIKIETQGFKSYFYFCLLKILSWKYCHELFWPVEDCAWNMDLILSWNTCPLNLLQTFHGVLTRPFDRFCHMASLGSDSAFYTWKFSQIEILLELRSKGLQSECHCCLI